MCSHATSSADSTGECSPIAEGKREVEGGREGRESEGGRGGKEGERGEEGGREGGREGEMEGRKEGGREREYSCFWVVAHH